jgi:anthranilate phosphoribosyltransferase
MTAAFAESFESLARGGVEANGVRRAFDAILAGAWSPSQIAAFLGALRIAGEPTIALVAAAEALRATMTAVTHAHPDAIDTCGTGGDGRGTINVSTAAAVLVAAVGVPVAKHGNRSVSSRSGSADVLEALGLPLDVPPERQGEVLDEAGIAFLLAPAHHPALRHAAPVRRELGVRTMFNALGPLVNPARVTRQVIGVYDDALRTTMAEALAALGAEHAWVCRSDDGLDEISPEAPTRVSVVRGGAVREMVVTPGDFGLAASPANAIDGGSPEENARALDALFRGEPTAALPTVVLAAAAALHVARDVPLEEAARTVTEAQRRGAGAEVMTRWKRAARRLREPTP